nr:putative ribonuclease H-like domain-containing protein [Tanacetum cinerariifolium]
MRPFGCHVTILNTLDPLGKFDGKADEGFFVGYSVNSKALRVFNSRTMIVEETLHITFLENKPNVTRSGTTWLFDIDTLTKSMNYKLVVGGNQSNGSTCKAIVETVPDNDDILLLKIYYSLLVLRIILSYSNYQIPKDHPVEQIIRDIHLETQTRRMTKNVTDHGMFSSVQQRINYKDFQNCLFACFLSQEEPKKQVWTLMDLPYGKRAIRTKWIYRNKKDERGIAVRSKERLVAQGYTQEEGIDYDEMGVNSAFLYGKIEEEVYVCQPPGFEDPEFPNRVYKIDKTLFIKKVKGDLLLVQLYIGDIIFGSIMKEMCTKIEKMMHKKFQMSSMGELTFFLGLQVTQKDDGIFISQDKYVDEILKKFGFLTVKTASTPIETSKPLMKDENVEDVDVYLYRSMIGSLMYLTSSRPNIMFDVCACERFQVTPKVSHLHAMKRIFRYLKGQPKLGLWYPKDSPFDLEAYTDSDYAGASLDKKSITGGCQFIGGRLISWQYKKQTVVANSTTKAEYVAASNCCGQVLWIQNQMLDYGYNFINIEIFIDNESTICIAKNPVFY